MNQKGLSLIEVLISSFIVAMMALIAAVVIVQQKKNNRQILFLQYKNEMVEEITSELSSYRHCTDILRASMPAATQLPDSFASTVPPNFMDERYFHPKLKIKEVRLQYAPTAQADSLQRGNSKTFRGTLELKMGPRAESIQNEVLELKTLVIPLTIYDRSGLKQWSDVLCVDASNHSNSVISETCAYYGGTLVDGTHCDFNRYMRRHQPLPAPAVPVIPVTDTSIVDGKPRVSRMTLPDIMCYLDTLVSLIPDVQFQNRKPDDDRYLQTRHTLFCKRPGKVPQAPSVDMDRNLQTMSVDVRGFFTEIQNEP